MLSCFLNLNCSILIIFIIIFSISIFLFIILILKLTISKFKYNYNNIIFLAIKNIFIKILFLIFKQPNLFIFPYHFFSFLKFQMISHSNFHLKNLFVDYYLSYYRNLTNHLILYLINRLQIFQKFLPQIHFIHHLHHLNFFSVLFLLIL